VKAFLEDHSKIDTMFIGYPGDRSTKVGARGFLRSTASVYGKAEHSGSRKSASENALLKAAQLILAINSAKLPTESDPRFPDGPKVTVTSINGGAGFSVIPDKIELNVDMRLTPHVDQDIAEKWLRDIIKENDRQFPTSRATALAFRESWPAYAIPTTLPAAVILRESAVQAFGHDVQFEVCGPSNIGNLLAKEKIPAFCGFGVASENVHGANENVVISTVEPTYKTYLQTVKKLTTRTP
jgi:succinyl-diaminopimelate desuccinylase